MRRIFVGLLLTCAVFSANANDFAGRRFSLGRALTAATAEDASTASFSGTNPNSNPSALPGRTSSAPTRRTKTASFPTKREEEAADSPPTSQLSQTTEKEHASVVGRSRSESRSLRQDDGLENEASPSETLTLFENALLTPVLLVLAVLPCSLSERTLKRHLNEATRTWLVSHSLLDDVENDIQVIINCTKAGDVLAFSPERSIRPSSCVVIPWPLTLSATVENAELEEGVFPTSVEKATFTCPRENEGVFLVR